MKISNTQYAKALYEATVDKSQDEISSVLGNFVKILVKNNQLKFKKNIIAKFEEIYNQKKGIVFAEIITKEKVHTEVLTKIHTYIKDKYQAKEVILENKINENIKGGIIIKIGDEVLDGSVEKQLRELGKSLNH